MIIIFVFATWQILQLSLILSHICLSVSDFDSMLILCKIFVELEHFILFNNFEKYQTSFITG